MRRVLLIFMKTAHITILVFLVSCVIALPILANDIDSKIIKVNFGKSVSRAVGSDGRVIIYPSHWTTSEGSDGRRIAAPMSWHESTGSDGRRIAHPATWKTIEGRDGRIVAVPDANPVPLYFDDPTVVARILHLVNDNDGNANDVAIYWWINQDD